MFELPLETINDSTVQFREEVLAVAEFGRLLAEIKSKPVE